MATHPINENITTLKPSATLVINERSNELIQAGKKVYKLGFGQSPFPVPISVVQALKANAHQMAMAVAEILWKNNIATPKPIGGFYLMPDFHQYKSELNQKGIHTSHQLCETLLEETGVALLPLSAFGMPDNFLGARLSYVDFDGRKALQIIGKNPNATAEELAPKVMEGIQQMVNWITY